jgi:hypothetical protein
VVAVRRADGQWDRLHPWLLNDEPTFAGYGTPDATPAVTNALEAKSKEIHQKLDQFE